jgi:hypothetical protein
MRPVRTVEHLVDADQVDQVVDALLVERAHVDAVLDLFHRVAREGLRCLLVHLGHRIQKREHPLRPGLDDADLQLREPEQRPVNHPRRHRILDRTPLVEDAHRVGLEGQHLRGAAVPLGGVPRVTAVAGVHADEDVVLDATLPEGVELGQRERPGTAEAGDRSRADQDRAGAALDGPLQFLDRLLDDGQRDHRRGEDAVLVVEAPHLVQPLVEGVDDDVDRERVVGEPLLDEAGQRREHQRPVEAQLVHLLQPRRGLEERRDGLHRLTEEFALALAVRVAELEVLLPGAGLGDDREGGVRDVVADLPLERDLGTPVDLDVLDDVLVLLGEVLGHRLRRLIEVIVRIEQRKGDVDPV